MNENKKIALNSIVIFVRLVVTSIVGLLSSRLILHALGASDYGLYNVVGGLVVMLNVLNSAMITTTYRFIAFELGKKQNGDINKIFNASFAIHAFFALIVLVLGLSLGLFYVNNYLNVDPQKLADAQFVLVVSVATTSLSTLLVPYQGLLVAFEKFTVSAIIDIVTRIVYLFTIYYVLTLCLGGIRQYALIQLGLAVLSSICYYYYCLRNYSRLISFRINNDISCYKEMFSFTGWTLVGASANVFKTQGSAAVINYFFGTLINASYAIANQVESFILMFSRNLAQAAIPQITKNFSGSNQERSVRLTCYISKYTFMLMCVAAFPVILERDFLLNIWLGEVPNEASLYCALMILGGIVDCLGAGIPALVQATGKVKYFQLVCSGILLSGLPISFVCFKFGCPAYTILIIYILVGFLTSLSRIYLLKRILDFNVKSFFYISYSRMILISIPLIIAFLLYNPSSLNTWQHLFVLVLSEIYLFVDFLILGLDKNEKNKLIKYLRRNY